MRQSLRLLAALLWLATLSFNARSQTVIAVDNTPAAIARCSEKLVPYKDWPQIKNPLFSLDLASATKGHLFYFGARHSADPADPQFREIEEAWNKFNFLRSKLRSMKKQNRLRYRSKLRGMYPQRFKPTVAFYEGPNRPLAATRDETIKGTGESGFVRFLAKRDGVPFSTLEPPPQEEAAFVMQSFSLEQTMLFFLLREASRLRERRKMTEPEIKTTIAQLLERGRALKLFDSGGITTLDELDAAYRRYWKQPSEWWQAPVAWFDPLKTSAETGGLFTNEINRASSEFRNLHMYRLLAQAALEGGRVFAVVGRNHVPMQEPALRCALR